MLNSELYVQYLTSINSSSRPVLDPTTSHLALTVLNLTFRSPFYAFIRTFFHVLLHQQLLYTDDRDINRTNINIQVMDTQVTYRHPSLVSVP